MDASLEGPRGRQRSRQEVCHSQEQAYRVNPIATRYRSQHRSSGGGEEKAPA